MISEVNFTIIIPHRNGPDLLHRCLSSIPQRSDIEIIVVDDFSDDRGGIEKIFSLNRQRHKFFSGYFLEDSRGAGFARNYGMEKARGKWLLFADADDFYETKEVNVFFDIYGNSAFDVIYFSVRSVFSKTLEKSFRAFELSNIIFRINDKKLKQDKVKFSFWVPWNKMFRRSFVERYSLRFEETRLGNDAMFVLKAGWHAMENVELYNKAIYFVTESDKSMSFTRDKSWYFLYFQNLLKINTFLHEIDKSAHRKGFSIDLISCGASIGFKTAIGFYNQIKKNKKGFVLFSFYDFYLFFLRKLARLLKL